MNSTSSGNIMVRRSVLSLFLLMLFLLLTVEETEANEAPVASIDSITPNPAHEGAQVNFTGSGTDSDGDIIGYQWRSTLDGNLSSNVSFSNSSLSYGNHSIYFRVQDNESLWSEEVLAYLYVNAKPVADIDFILPFEAYHNPGTFDSNLSVWRYVKPVTTVWVPIETRRFETRYCQIVTLAAIQGHSS